MKKGKEVAEGAGSILDFSSYNMKKSPNP
ncbi:hypothetical protein ADUPG1_014515, partial [Aduncisulcus paluster]